MAGVSYNSQVRDKTFQFDGDLPLRVIAVQGLAVSGESPVNGGKFCNAGPVEPFQSANPQLHIGIDRVLNHNRDINSLQ